MNTYDEPNHLSPYIENKEVDNRCNPQHSTHINMWTFSMSEFKTESYEPEQQFLIVFKGGELGMIEYDDFYDNIMICSKGITHYLPITLKV